MNTWGHNIRLSIFGESHGKAVGMVLDGFPAGERIDMEQLEREMERRAPGRDPYSTARREEDKVEIFSGLHDGKTTGSPICGVIRNKDSHSADYGTKFRPGHADWTAFLKYGGHADMRGGGHFSGRLTAPLVFAGAVAKQLLARRGVKIYGRLAAAGGIADPQIPREKSDWEALSRLKFPASEAAGEKMREAIRLAKEDGDSVGGVVETVAFGVPGGLGDPFFASLESRIAALFFSIPAVKGVEFGDGFPLSALRGSEANDEIYAEDGRIFARSNHNGGILGGISNGMPILVRAAVKPTASIALLQQTVDAADLRNAELQTKGRHDPCIAPRATPVLEAALALCVLDCCAPNPVCTENGK
ncbi:MAG: chorismate synthase [Clostridiales Family XIII bacterium]|jgi:chorismate synthase|nr:chorismate synthase [Clostridiales Family XIII bacterium]